MALFRLYIQFFTELDTVEILADCKKRYQQYLMREDLYQINKKTFEFLYKVSYRHTYAKARMSFN